MVPEAAMAKVRTVAVFTVTDYGDLPGPDG
jgi:hypothetical protein